MRRFALALAVLALSSACDPKTTPPAPSSNGPVLNAAEAGFVSAYCDYLGGCGQELGYMFDPAACVGFLSLALLDQIADGGRNAEPADADACAAFLRAKSCDDLRDPAMDDAACDRMMAAWDGETPSTVVPVGAECSSYSSDCAGGSGCVNDTTGGPVCRRCVAAVGLGQSCANAPCGDGLRCSVSLTPVCETLVGASCNVDWLCGAHMFCDGANGCQERVAGSPCDEPAFDWCGGADESLICIAGDCAAPSALDGPCDDRDDCARASLGCIAHTCKGGLARGAACTSDDECKGFLVCNGTCTDLPTLGAQCDNACLLPYACLAGTCAPPPDGDQSLAIGAACAGSCGTGCHVSLGTCAGGFCDTFTTADTHKCEPFVAVGQPCDVGEPQCDPDVAYCDYGTPSVCTAFTALGASCADGSRCNLETAFCDYEAAAPVCAARRANGASCTDSYQCIGERCLGTCAGGNYDGLPCTSSWDCGYGNTCTGVCGDQDTAFARCAP